MSEFLSFLHLGFRHIVSPSALDHVLFLLALAAIYRRHDWRDAVWVISAFTVGHSITLALVSAGAIVVAQPLAEFLVPLTIVVTGLENILVRARARNAAGSTYRPVFAGVFGLVHGAGFASYLQRLFSGSIVIPLLGFNLGVELGQLLVLGAAGAALFALDRLLAMMRLPMRVTSPFRLRVITVSLLVIVVAGRMVVARQPW